MMEFICWLIFIKIVLQVVKTLKKIVIIEKDYNGKRLQTKIPVSNRMNLVVL